MRVRPVSVARNKNPHRTRFSCHLKVSKEHSRAAPLARPALLCRREVTQWLYGYCVTSRRSPLHQRCFLPLLSSLTSDERIDQQHWCILAADRLWLAECHAFVVRAHLVIGEAVARAWTQVPGLLHDVRCGPNGRDQHRSEGPVIRRHQSSDEASQCAMLGLDRGNLPGNARQHGLAHGGKLVNRSQEGRVKDSLQLLLGFDKQLQAVEGVLPVGETKGAGKRASTVGHEEEFVDLLFNLGGFDGSQAGST